MSILTLAAKDLRLLVRDTRALVILLAMPLIFIVVLGLALGETFGQKPDDSLRITIVDDDEGLPPNPGPFPGRKWSEVVRDDLAGTGGIKVEVVPGGRAAGEELRRRGRRAAVIVFGSEFSRRVHRCSFLDDKFLPEPGINPFFRNGVRLGALDVEVLEDDNQVLAASIIRQVAQVSLLRVVLPWMIGKAFDKLSDRQFIDELGQQIKFSVPLRGKVALGSFLVTEEQKREVGDGVKKALQELFSKYDLTAKTWQDLTEPKRHPARPPDDAVTGGGVAEYHDTSGSGLLSRGAVRYQILVPSYTVMFAFFLVLSVGWLFVAERRQGTLLRLRAAPLTRTHILLGKMVPCLVVSLVQGFFLLGAGRVVFGMSWGAQPWLLVPVVVCTSLAAMGLALLVASAARTETQVAVYGTLLVLVLAGLSGCIMPRDLMPEAMQQLSLVTPHAWALEAYKQVLTTPAPDTAAVGKDCLALAGFGLGFVALSWARLRLD
jgi:ABC-type Na+ efflux pump permease subunit